MDQTTVLEYQRKLSEQIGIYLNANSVRNVKQLSAKLNIPVTNMRRIVNCERTPTEEELSSILKTVFENDPPIFEYSIHLFPNKADYWAQVYGTRSTSDSTLVNSDVSQYFANKRYFSIMNLAFLDGITIEEIRKMYGKDGDRRLNELLQAKVVKLDGNKVIGIVSDDSFQVNMSDTLKQIKHSVEEFKPEKMGTNSNQAFFMTFSSERPKRRWFYDFLRVSRQIVREMMNKNTITEDTKNLILKLLNVNLSEEIESSKDGTKKEPIFYSVVMDDFTILQNQERQEVLQ